MAYNSMTKAIMSIVLNEQGDVDVQFKGTGRELVPMMGALSVANDWILNELKRSNGMQSSKMVKRVSKNEAINHYLKKRTEIEDRLKAIACSDERVEFEVE